MTELLTAAQMRAIEAAAIASGQVTGLELMERAGRGVVDAIFAEWPGLRATSHRAVVLCGPGNNGGDGFVVARLLKDWGWEVEVFLYGTPEGMPPDARVNYERLVGMGKVGNWQDYWSVLRQHKYDREMLRAMPYLTDSPKAALVIDALFGIGLTRPMDDDDLLGLTMASRMLALDGKAVCIDLPSGICADSGRTLVGRYLDYPCDPLDLCVTFHLKKVAHVLNEGALLAKKVVVIDVGLPSPPSEYHRTNFLWEVIREDILKPTFTMPLAFGLTVNRDIRKKSSTSAAGRSFISPHKFSHGHALVLSGGVGHGGAARLAARGALRIGAGLVTLACPPAALIENSAHLNAIMLRKVTAETLPEALSDPRITALCLGPGLGVDRAGAMLRTCLVDGGVKPRPTVLDADALTALARAPDLFAALHPACVLTPHHGEFAGLFPDIAAKLDAPATTGPAYSKVRATRDAAFRAGCVVLYKGPDTVIADPEGRCAINSAAYDRAAPWLATAGSGDVLAGFITGLLARGFQPFDAACTGAWLHVECARSFGPGLIAEDLPEELPKVFRALGL